MVAGNEGSFMGKDFEEVELGSCVILGKVMGIEGPSEFFGKDFVFNYVFGYFVWVSSYNRFRANTP